MSESPQGTRESSTAFWGTTGKARQDHVQSRHALRRYRAACASILRGQLSPGHVPWFTARAGHYSLLARHNSAVLRAALPKTLLRRVRSSTLSLEQSVRASVLVQHHLFQPLSPPGGPTFLDALERRNVIKLRALLNQNVEELTGRNLGLCTHLASEGLALVVVRPEFYHLRQLVIDHMVVAGFQILMVIQRRIEATHYWALYQHVVGDPIKESHVRRRALGYIGKPLALIFGLPSCKRATRLAWRRSYGAQKGVAGVPDLRTLRGDLVFREMACLERNLDRAVIGALDPIQDFRFSDQRLYNRSVASTFVANLPGVHIPDEEDLAKDLAVLISADEAEDLCRHVDSLTLNVPVGQRD